MKGLSAVKESIVFILFDKMFLVVLSPDVKPEPPTAQTDEKPAAHPPTAQTDEKPAAHRPTLNNKGELNLDFLDDEEFMSWSFSDNA